MDPIFADSTSQNVRHGHENRKTLKIKTPIYLTNPKRKKKTKDVTSYSDLWAWDWEVCFREVKTGNEQESSFLLHPCLEDVSPAVCICEE